MRLLIATAESGSVSAAAAQLGLAQPNASRALRGLERDLGLPLLLRTPRGSTVTTEGQVVVNWARGVVDAYESLVDGIAALRHRRSGQVSVSASMTVAEYLVPLWLGRLRQVHPGVQVSLQVANSHDVCVAVNAGVVDLGFVESMTLPARIGHRLLGRDELTVVVSPDHPWTRRRRPLTTDDLAATPLLVREPGSGTRESFDQLLSAATDTDPVAPAQELGSNAAIKVAAVAGMAPAVLSRLAVRDLVDAGRLVEIPVADLDLHRPLHAVWATTPRGACADLLRIAELSRRSGAGRDS